MLLFLLLLCSPSVLKKLQLQPLRFILQLCLKLKSEFVVPYASFPLAL